MKIVYVNTLYYPNQVGGAERSVQLLAEAMVANGHEAHVITLFQGRAYERDEHNGVSIHRLPLRNVYWPSDSRRRGPLKRLAWHLIDTLNWCSARDVRRVLEVISPDIVHTNGLSGFSVSVWGAGKWLGVPVVHSARDYYLIHPNSKLHTAKGRQRPDSLTCKIWSAPKRMQSRRVTAFVSISDYVKNLHMDLGFFPNALATTIYNPIRLPQGFVGKSGGRRTYGYLGRLDESKGLDVLLAAFACLDGEANRLLIAGTGESAYERRLKDSCGPNVEMLGHVAPSDFFKRIDCLVVPSRWAEPLGRVVLEAYAHGVPVIGSDSGGIPEIIQEGKTGYTFRTGDPRELRDRMIQLQDLPREETSAECLRFSHQFSDEVIIDSFIGFYKKVVQKHVAG